MKGINARIKCPRCGQTISVKNYTQHIKSDKCKNKIHD